MKIIGIDPAYADTHIIGLATIDLETRAENVYPIRPPDATLPIWTRQKKVVRSVIEYIQPEDIVLIEDYAYSQNSSSDAHLKELGGLLRHSVLKITGLWPVTVGIGTLKKFMTGKGNTKKNLILKEVLKKWGKDFNDDNEADAYGLAKLGYALIYDAAEGKNEQDCMKAVIKGLDPEQLRIIRERKSELY